jgi:hypothetical protein
VLAFNRGDADGSIELFDPDVEFVTGEHDVWRGHAGMRAYMEQLGELWPKQRLNDVEIPAESASALVISAVQHVENAARRLRVAEPPHPVMALEAAARAASAVTRQRCRRSRPRAATEPLQV